MDSYITPYMASVSQWLDSIKIPAMEGESPVLQFIGRWGYRAYAERDVIQMYVHLLLAAIFPIYIGSHAALRCPPSASDPAKKKSSSIASQDDDDDELDEIEAESTVEGLTPSDAILFPVFASLTLGGLYLLIKWLNDPTLLNKLLGYYFSLIGIFGVGKLIGDALNVWTTVLFPSVWSSGKEVYFVDPLLSQQFSNGPNTKGPNRATVHRNFTGKTSPLPGALSNLKLSEKISRWLWATRALFTNHWIFRGYVHGLMKVKSRVRFNDVIGLLVGVGAIVLYNTTGKVWWLTNLMGFGFCYGTLQLMSPTTFWTGSLILAGLFVYDVVMVFYTPLMVTVATTLDVPIKLVFPGPNRGSMLGLGDVVLPGIMIAIALRFDLYLHYLRKPAPPASSHSLHPSANPKPSYEPATGRWGERFWTRSVPTSALPPTVAGVIFPKVYFYASVIGYFLGLLATLVVLNIFNHAQPALLYLVPGVLGSLWGTALVRRELKLMWNYTEAEDAEDQDKGQEGSAEKAGTNKKDPAQDNPADKTQKSNKAEVKAPGDEHAHHVFLFSLSAPRRGPKKSKFV